ncbi:MAG TPA: hypothetical protein VK964_02125 [Nocardioidaceae bacterium]|nr:hypothetical protein [Nocardioidaceae bacterium]
MTPLQKIAMGLVITLVDAIIAGYDAVPDVLGWVLVVMGLIELRDRMTVSTLLPLAVIAGIVSLASIRPSLLEDLPESTGWLLSLAQIAFSFVLCAEVAPLVSEPLARRFRVLRWVFLVVGAGPVLLYGGGVDILLVPLAVLSVATGVYLVYLLFRASTGVHGPRVRPQRPSGHEGPDGPAPGNRS